VSCLQKLVPSGAAPVMARTIPVWSSRKQAGAC
jgi:hypothetical protein